MKEVHINAQALKVTKLYGTFAIMKVLKTTIAVDLLLRSCNDLYSIIVATKWELFFFLMW